MDSIGAFLNQGSYLAEKISVDMLNIPIYLEDSNSTNSGDLVEYSEPWGGSQNVPYTDAVRPNDREQDKSMYLQGERPETLLNAAPPEDFPVSTTNALGQLWGRSSDPGAGDGAEPLQDSVRVKPRGYSDSQDEDFAMPPIGEPFEHSGDNEEQTFSDRVYLYASENTGDKDMQGSKRETILRVMEASLKKGSLFVDNPNRLKIACVGDLYPFHRVSSDTLIHKSSKELWSIQLDGDGHTVIEKQFDDNGKPVMG